MLYVLEKTEPVEKLPYKRKFDSWMKGLSHEDYDKIIQFFDEKSNDDEEIMTSSWLPGKHWGGTIFEPIYIACNRNHTNAALFFGLLLYDYMMKREDEWVCGHFEKNGVAIRGLTYFRKTK